MERGKWATCRTYLGEATTESFVEKLGHLSDTETLLKLSNGIANIGDYGTLRSFRKCQQ